MMWHICSWKLFYLVGHLWLYPFLSAWKKATAFKDQSFWGWMNEVKLNAAGRAEKGISKYMHTENAYALTQQHTSDKYTSVQNVVMHFPILQISLVSDNSSASYWNSSSCHLYVTLQTHTAVLLLCKTTDARGKCTCVSVSAWPENHIPPPDTYTQNQCMTPCLPHSMCPMCLLHLFWCMKIPRCRQRQKRFLNKNQLNPTDRGKIVTHHLSQSYGTSFLFLFSLRCTAVCHNITSFPMKTNKCHTVTSPLAPWTPAGILCQSDKQSPDTSQPLSEQKNRRKRSGTCPISLPRNYSVPYVSGWV